MARQDADGGWHSRTYGGLRGGAAATALVLYAMGHVPAELRERHSAKLERGFAFLRQGLRRRGCIACPDGTLDYPIYATAMTLTAAEKLDLGISSAERGQLAEYLCDAQLAEEDGFERNDPHFGGWDLMGTVQAAETATPGTNVSVTCFALEALSAQHKPRAAEACRRAIHWLNRCQDLTGDGGFLFTPDRRSLDNKAQSTGQQPNGPWSYGTATCDGLRSLRYARVPGDDERFTAAAGWLAKRAAVDVVPGFERVRETQWQVALRYYYYATLAKSLEFLPDDRTTDLRRGLARQLSHRQRDDGSWKNRSPRMREDDPLIATSLSMIALAELQRGT